MANRSGPDGVYYMGRDRLESDRQTHKKNKQRPKSFASTAPQHFVPGFAVRRRVLATPEAKEFVHDLRRIFARNYSVLGAGSMALTILEQQRLVRRFRQAEVVPDPEDIEQVAVKTARELGRSLDGIPRRLTVPTGPVDHFGKEGKKFKIGVTLRGWRGFAAPYAEHGIDKSILPMPVIVRETDLCVGGLVNAFGGNEILEHGIRLDGISRTPHITVASKDRGGPISRSELASYASAIEEVMPDELQLFDPTVYMQLEPGKNNATVLHARAPRLSRYGVYLPGGVDEAA